MQNVRKIVSVVDTFSLDNLSIKEKVFNAKEIALKNINEVFNKDDFFELLPIETIIIHENICQNDYDDIYYGIKYIENNILYFDVFIPHTDNYKNIFKNESTDKIIETFFNLYSEAIAEIKFQTDCKFRKQIKSVLGEVLYREVIKIENDSEKLDALAIFSNNLDLKQRKTWFESFMNNFISKEYLLVSIDGNTPIYKGNECSYHYDEENEIFIVKDLVNKIDYPIVDLYKRGKIWVCQIANKDKEVYIRLFDIFEV